MKYFLSAVSKLRNKRIKLSKKNNRMFKNMKLFEQSGSIYQEYDILKK
jgi:hypothetical protein